MNYQVLLTFFRAIVVEYTILGAVSFHYYIIMTFESVSALLCWFAVHLEREVVLAGGVRYYSSIHKM